MSAPLASPHAQSVSSTIHEVVVQLDLDRRVVWASASLFDALGWGASDVLGHELTEFIVAPDDDSAGEVDPLVVTHTLDTRLTMRHRDGSTRWCRATLHPMLGSRGAVHSVVVTLRGFAAAPGATVGDLDLYQILAENISDVVSMTEGDGVISWVSPSIETLLGRPATDVVGHSFREFILVEDQPVLEDVVRRILRGDDVHFEIRLMHRDASIRWAAITAHLVDLPGRDRARIAVWRDVTDAVDARQSLIQSRRDFQRVAENASDVVIQTDVLGRIDWVSPSISTVLGWRSFDVVGKNFLNFVAPSDAARAAAWQALILTGEQVRSAQMRYRSASNETKWMAIRAQALMEDGSACGIIMSLRDCHGEVVVRRALNTLSASSRALTRSDNEHELLSTMCQAAVNEGGYLLCWYARPDLENPQDFTCVSSSFEHRHFAESRTLSLADEKEGSNPAGLAWRNATTVVVNDRFNDGRFPVTDTDAESQIFRASIALPVRCARVLDGVLVVYAPETGAFDATVTNVLEELAAQIGFGIQRLRDRASLLQSLSEQRLLGAAVNQSGESIAITDTHANLIYANPSVLSSSGYELDELIGNNPRIFQSGLQNKAFYEAMWQQLSSGATWRGVLVNKRKSGELYEEEATISPVHDDDGRVTAFVAVKRDLTVERRLQANLTSDSNDRTTILEIMREMRPVSSLEAMANLFCRLVTRIDGVDTSTLMILHLDGTLSVMGQHGLPAFVVTPTPSFPAELVADQIRGGQPAAVLALDDEKWAGYPAILEGIKALSVSGAVVSPLR